MSKIKESLKMIGQVIIMVSVIGIFFYLSNLSSCNNESEYESSNNDTIINPRKTVGIDSTVYGDSVYIFSKKIDTVYEWYIHKRMMENRKKRQE